MSKARILVLLALVFFCADVAAYFRSPVHEPYRDRHSYDAEGVPFATQDSFFQSIYITPPTSSFSYAATMTGDWGGLRRKLEEDGVIVGLSYTNNILGNPSGGVSQGFAYTDSIGLNLIFDLYKLMRLPGWSFYSAFVQRDGPSLSNDNIENIFNVSQIYGGQNFRLDNLYLNWESSRKKANFSIGRLNAGDYFLQSPLYYAYINNGYNGNPVSVFFNAPFSAYPNAQWGAYLYLRPSDILATKFAVFNTNTSVSENKYHGFNFSFQGNNGVMLITELDLLSNRKLCFLSCRLPGRYTVGFMYYTGKDQVNFLTQQQVTGNYGFYYQLEQKLYQPDANALRGISAFFEMSLFPAAYNTMPYFYDAGLIYRGILPSRPKDFLTLGYAYGKFSENLATSEVALGNRPQTYEANIEVNYCIYATPWLFIQPGIQYVIRPSGYTNIPNAWVLGAQMSISF